MSKEKRPVKLSITIPDTTAQDEGAPLINNSLVLTPGGHRIQTPTSPADKVRTLLTPTKSDRGDSSSSSDEDGDEEAALTNVLHEHYLYCQLNRLCHFPDGETGWKEVARWLKYEEKLEMGERWSKPHVATSSMHSLLELRSYFEDGSAVVELDAVMKHGCIREMAEVLGECIKKQHPYLTEAQLNEITDVLVGPYKHANRTADSKKKKERVKSQKSMEEDKEPESPKKKKRISRKGSVSEIPKEYHVYAEGVLPSDLKPYKPNKKLLKKIPPGAEIVNILVGQLSILEKPIVALVRLCQGQILSGIAEVELPTRFVFVALGPMEGKNIREYEELGRAAGTLFSDKVFSEVAYRASNRNDILDGIDEYIDEVTVLPPSVWDPEIRLMPPSSSINENKLRERLMTNKRYGHELELEPHDCGDPSLKRTGKIFGGLINDIKRRYPLYKSDIVDGFHIQSVATIVFLFFACITPIVTFGGLMGTATDGLMGTMESILSGAICGILFALFAGQPLTIVGATGPLLIFESILYQFCKEQEVDFLAFRFWVGAWSTFILLVIVMFDLSFLVGYITRFTEESFSVLISLIFIMEAFKKAIAVWGKYPVHTGVVREDPAYTCYCVNPGNNTSQPPIVAPPEGLITEDNGTASNYTIIPKTPFNPYNWSELVLGGCITHDGKVEVNHDCISAHECINQDWLLIGDACHDPKVVDSVPDVFLLSLFLFLGTFVLAMFFRSWRNARYFPSVVRFRVADFAVLLSILANTGLDYGFGLSTPKLNVPEKFATTVPSRGWFANPVNLGSSWYLALLAALPAMLGTILIFLDQQITCVIINRKDHKLKKPPGYHLDLFILAITIMICSTLGLPWFVAATVRSITHLKSLAKQSEVSVPGETPTFEGIREQRLTGFCIHVLIAVSVFCTPILKFIPMPVLYGVFLYMGVTSLGGVQFIQRIKIMLMPAKYQPDYVYLRHVPTERVHIFTAIQILCMVGMWVVKSIKKIAITFPLLVLALCFVRKAMDFWYFTQQDLYWLDHILPEEERRRKEDEALKNCHDPDELALLEKEKPWPHQDGGKSGSSSSLKKE